MNLGEKIFKLRKEKGLSQEALAEQLGTTRQDSRKQKNCCNYQICLKYPLIFC